MRSLTNQLSHFLTIVFAICFVFQFVQSSFVETVYTGTLTPQQVIPDNGILDLSYNGAILCVYIRESPISLDCQIQHNLGSNATSIQIHNAIRGQSGSEIFTFNSTLENSRQIFEFTATNNLSAEELQTEFLDGRFYVSVYSQFYTNGVIRAQIEHKNRAYSRMNVANTIPSSSGSTATGIALATYSFYPNKILALDVIHNIVDPTELDLNIGYVNEIGSTAYSFLNTKSPAFDSVSLTLFENEYLFEDLLYLNFRSSANPTGDIRGQLISVDYPAYISFSALLQPDSGEYSGAAIVSYDCSTQILEYLIIHNLPNPTGAFISQQSSGAIDTLSYADSPLYGSITLLTGYVSSLYNGELYFTIESGYATLTGTLNSNYKYWTYLTGMNELPAISTGSVGVALMNVSGTIINYQIHHLVDTPTSVIFKVGQEGNTGPVLETLSEISVLVNGVNVSSPLVGSFNISTSNLNKYFEQGLVYIEIATQAYPLGIIRGQVYDLAPCVISESPITVISNTYDVLSYFDSLYPTFSDVIIVSSNAVIVSASLFIIMLTFMLSI